MISNNPPQSPGSSLSIPGPTLTRPSPTPSSGSALTNLGRPTLTVDPTDTSASQDPTVHGDKVLQKWATDLPFLCKVLSVQKALSIQAHPDKEMARVLHKLHPGVYRDDNHKPEVALALTEFEALCGFISLKMLSEFYLLVRDTRMGK